MARKRKTDAAPRLDEADRTLYSSFCGAANSLSQLYSQAMAQQKLSFQAGERHALSYKKARVPKYELLFNPAFPEKQKGINKNGEIRILLLREKLHQWILRKHDEESRLTVADIMSHIQHEIDYGGTDVHVSPSIQPSAGSYTQATSGHAPRPSLSDQSKNTIFSNALSSPVRRSLQTYHLTQGAGNGGRNTEANSAAQNREANSASSNDTSMDMVSDSAGNGYY